MDLMSSGNPFSTPWQSAPGWFAGSPASGVTRAYMDENGGSPPTSNGEEPTLPRPPEVAQYIPVILAAVVLGVLFLKK